MNGPRRIRFLKDDQFGLWHEGDRGFDLGQEHPTVPVWVIERKGELLALTRPYERGIIALDEDGE